MGYPLGFASKTRFKATAVFSLLWTLYLLTILTLSRDNAATIRVGCHCFKCWNVFVIATEEKEGGGGVCLSSLWLLEILPWWFIVALSWVIVMYSIPSPSFVKVKLSHNTAWPTPLTAWPTPKLILKLKVKPEICDETSLKMFSKIAILHYAQAT